MKKQIEQQRDELAKKHRREIIFMRSEDDLVDRAFKFGFNSAHPIIRADERERILGLLRSEELDMHTEWKAEELADWLESKLKELDNAKD